MQKISSAGTSGNRVPAVLNKIVQAMRLPAAYVASLHDVLDFGGGKYDQLTKQLARYNIRNWIYDPYNRPEEHNASVVQMLRSRPASAAICSNVLNVIREREERLAALRMIRMLTEEGGYVFITTYEGDRSSRGKKTSRGWQSNRPTSSYMREVRKIFPTSTYCNNKLIIATVQRGSGE